MWDLQSVFGVVSDHVFLSLSPVAEAGKERKERESAEQSLRTTPGPTPTPSSSLTTSPSPYTPTPTPPLTSQHPPPNSQDTREGDPDRAFCLVQ